MEHYLALDVGLRRTGVALADSETGIALPRDSLRHESPEELLEAVLTLQDQKPLDLIIVGLPYLPSGEEGAQAAIARSVGQLLEGAGFIVEYVDERYTTPRTPESDGDAAAACSILTVFLDKKSNSSC